MSEQELRTVIRAAAARERNKGLRFQSLHRGTRLAAVAFYKEKFGDAEFLVQFSARKLPRLKAMWLPGGYAYWKERSNNALNTDGRASGASAG